MSSPYSKLGEYDPFGVSNVFSLPFCLAEAFKKLTCGGIDGRLKSANQDYKEAVYSIERAIKDVSKYHLQKTAKASLIDEIMGRYNDAFQSKDTSAYKSARHILLFAQSGCFHYLESALLYARQATESTPINLISTARVDWETNPMFYRFHSRETKSRAPLKAKQIDMSILERRKRG